MGGGSTLVELHYSYRIGRSTLSKLVRKVCRALWTTLRCEMFPAYTEDRWSSICEGFETKTNFPNCIGAIDGKHIRCIKPSLSGSLYFNYKHYFSFVLLAIADASYNFIYIDVGAPGKDSDSTIFEKSSFNIQLENGSLNIPRGKVLPGTNRIMPYVFVADEAFALSRHILRPFSGRFLSYEKRIFNYRLSRARRYVECTFGILTNKWRILHRPLNVSLDFAKDIVKACCILHNFVRNRDGYSYDDTLTTNGLFADEAVPTVPQGGRALNQQRHTWADYFVSDAGRVPWQDRMV